MIPEFIKEVSLLLPNPCHFQNYDHSMSQLSSGSEGGRGWCGGTRARAPVFGDADGSSRLRRVLKVQSKQRVHACVGERGSQSEQLGARLGAVFLGTVTEARSPGNGNRKSAGHRWPGTQRVGPQTTLLPAVTGSRHHFGYGNRTSAGDHVTPRLPCYAQPWLGG